MPQTERVLVTGGTDYIASFCIAELLRGGATVVTTVRSLAREGELRRTIAKLVKADDRLEVLVVKHGVIAGLIPA